MKTYNSVIELIGNTPIVQLKKIQKEFNLKANIFAKLEYFNPMGSSKDRAAYYMIIDAIEKGHIKETTTIIEPTSGNTGIALAAIASYLGYKIILTMPETMSIERRTLLRAYGAKIVLTQGSKGMQGAVDKALELNKEIKDSFIPSQFENENNPKAHFETTAKEIYDCMEGKINAFISPVGTGGTITGVGEFLKSKNSDIKIIAIEPESSPLLSKGIAGKHKIQGIGANFIPKILNQKIYDEIITCTNENAIKLTALIAKKEGLLVGISSGASLYGAIELAKRKEYENKNIVAFFPDSGSRYLSSDVF